MFPLPTHHPTLYAGEAAPRLRGDELAWGRFGNETTDPKAVSPSEISALVALVEEGAFGTAVRLLADESQLERGSPATQVLMNVPFEHSLITVALPPGWDPAQKIPILFSGNPGTTSNHQRLFGGQSDAARRYNAKEILFARNSGVAHAQGTSQSGIMAVLHNVGGMAAQGSEPPVLSDVGCAISWLSARLGGDANRVVFAGKSRGGGSALAWGANPLGLPYKAVGVFAHVPMWRVSYSIALPFSLFPASSFPSAKLLFGDAAFYYRNIPGPREVEGRMWQIRSPLGTKDSLAATEIAAHANGLRNVPAVSVCIGTHDQELPASDGMHMLQTLDALGVRHHSEVMVRGGHADCPGVTTRLEEYLKSLVGIPSSLALPLSGRTYVVAPRIGEPQTAPTPLAVSDIPWFGHISVLSERRAPLSVFVCGKGGPVRVTGTDNEVRFDSAAPSIDGCREFLWTAPAAATRIRWKIELPGGTDGASHGLLASRPLETEIYDSESEVRPVEDYFWDTSDRRMAGFAVVP